jgi:transcription elongation GreA/GreB family factor
MALGDLRGGPAGVGAHVTLEDGRGALSAVFLVARGGGVTLPGGVRAVSVASPLGAALVGKHESDEVEVPRGPALVSYVVRSVQ